MSPISCKVAAALQALAPSCSAFVTRPTKKICRSTRRCVLRTTKQDLHMMKTLLMGGATALMFMTSHAVADGTPGFAAPNWTGFYVGLGVGGAFATHDLSAKDIQEQQTAA